MNMRMASVPLIVSDPYFSVWSAADRLYDRPTQHWTGKETAVCGAAEIDGVRYRFMGGGDGPTMSQVSLSVTATSTRYVFEAAGVRLSLRFTTPLLLSEPELLSRPCTYADFTAESADGEPHAVSLSVRADENLCHTGSAPEAMSGGALRLGTYGTVWMGKARQLPLGHSGDQITIDWGYFYLAAPPGGDVRFELARGERTEACARVELGNVESRASAFLVFAYDDLVSINYFGRPTRAYWARDGRTIFEALADAVAEHDALTARCDLFDADLAGRAAEAGGEEYAFLCAASYRQSIAAHKLIADENGDLVFLSKECNSNGCIGTVDVSYPSAPLYLIYNPELVCGMLRPIFRFASLPVWGYDFAPHDVGRYPYATGQVYGLSDEENGTGVGRNPAPDGIHLPNYAYPAGLPVFRTEGQMPVEECGNMLILCAAVARAQGTAAFAAPHRQALQKWVCYLLKYGADPGTQLCTDDFAGHFAHNVNLAAKAVMGVASFGILLSMQGERAEAEQYLARAAAMAADWERRADAGSHTRLCFDLPDSWSLKYNMVWDRLFGTGLFSDGAFRREIEWYKSVQNRYGVPLDNRRGYTKSDWILWCAAFAEGREDREALIRPVARYLHETPDREPFADWYETETGRYHEFRNRTVQGGVFMPLLRLPKEKG